MADAGLFGPRTVTWHLHGDPMMWVAGICSLFLQALHPRAVAAVVQNSRFHEDPIGRLRRTSDFVGVATYGTTDKAGAAAQRVRHVHRTLRAHDPRTGEPIRLDDPDLLLRVHCAEVATFAEVVRRAGFPLSDAQQDRYFDEQRRSAELVGLDPQQVPGSRSEMTDYFRRVRPELARTRESDVVFRFLHHPFTARRLRPLNLGYLPIGYLAYSLLPDWAHGLHGRPALPAPVVTVGARAFRVFGKSVPDHVRYRFPSGHVLAAVERLGEGAFPSTRALAKL